MFLRLCVFLLVNMLRIRFPIAQVYFSHKVFCDFAIHVVRWMLQFQPVDVAEYLPVQGIQSFTDAT